MTREVVVIGAGPYGLSIAAHLREAGVPVRVFGRVMSTWHDHMPDGMFLKSVPAASNLSAPKVGATIFDYCSEIGAPRELLGDAIPIDLFAGYGLWFAERFVPDVETDLISSVRGDGSGYVVQTTAGDRVRTPAVVVASGVAPYAYTPPELSALAGAGDSEHALVSHTADHADISGWTGRSVAIVGAGQSALESAALLAEAGAAPHILARRDRVLWGRQPRPEAEPSMRGVVKPWSPLGDGWSGRALSDAPGLVRHLPAATRLALVRSVLGPSGAWWLRQRVDGIVPVSVGVEVRSAQVLSNAQVRLTVDRGGATEQLDVDHVLAATGYRVDLDDLTFIDEEIRRRVRRVAGAPLLGGNFESSERGLFFSGLTAAATFGPLLRFVAGTDFAARRITSAITRRND